MTDLPVPVSGSLIPGLRSFVDGAVEESKRLIADYDAEYANLEEEVAAALTELDFQLRWRKIRLWWDIGGVILDWHRAAEDFEGGFVPLEKFCNAVGKKLGRGERSCYNAVQIREKFPTEESLAALPFGKAVSLRLIVNKVIPGLNAGKSLAQITQEDRMDMAAKSVGQPIILYEGRCILDNSEDGCWAAILPKGVCLKAWPGDEAELTIMEIR